MNDHQWAVAQSANRPKVAWWRAALMVLWMVPVVPLIAVVWVLDKVWFHRWENRT